MKNLCGIFCSHRHYCKYLLFPPVAVNNPIHKPNSYYHEKAETNLAQ